MSTKIAEVAAVGQMSVVSRIPQGGVEATCKAICMP